MKDRLQLRRPPDDHDFGSLLMLAITAGAFLLITWVATKALFAFLLAGPNLLVAEISPRR